MFDLDNQDMIYNAKCEFFGYTKDKCDRQGECIDCHHNKKTKSLYETKIEQIKILLNYPGTKEWMWQEIEKYHDIKKRLKYRQIFFLAGGEVNLTEWENKILEQLKKGG